ncbi:MAG: hypothetical protein RLZZ420_1451 [Bacteroidota bacterium]|jgi:hypothetical protein
MKNMMSRYGGHAIIMQPEGAVKASMLELPEDQSFENIMGNHARQMNGFSYLSSYKSIPAFMGPYKKLPKGCIKIGELEHPFLDLLMQFDVDVTSSLYLTFTGYSNVFGLIVKTGMQELEWCMGKMESSYDLVLMIRVLGKSNEEITSSLDKIISCMIVLLVREMEVGDSDCSFIPSRTYLGKKLDKNKIDELLKKLKNQEVEDWKNLIKI